MIRQQGASLVSAVLAVAASITIMLIMLPPLFDTFNTIKNSATLERFVKDTFVAMDIHFHSEVNKAGGCYSKAPSSLKAKKLVTDGLLDDQYTQSSFFDAEEAELSYKRTGAGRVNWMQIEVAVPHDNPRDYASVPFFNGVSGSTMTFQKRITYSMSGLIMNNLKTSTNAGEEVCKEN